MLQETQETTSQLNVSTEKSSTSQETVEMINIQETRVSQETHQKTHLLQQSEEVERIQVSQETEEVQKESSSLTESAWTSSQSESSTCERSSSTTMSLTERFAVDSQQRYASTQETIRRDERREETEVEKKKKVGESGCILGKHMKVIKAAMEELEGSQKMEEQLDPSDTEHLHRRQVVDQPSTSSYTTTTAKESDEETMTTTTFKDTDWESTTFKETEDEGDTTAKETEDEGDETETEDEETVSMRKRMGAVFLTECSSSQVRELRKW